MTTELPQLWLVEYGEYSDRGWVPLVLPPEFDIRVAAEAFYAEVFNGSGPTAYSIRQSLDGFLVSRFGARDPEFNEPLRYMGAVEDPIHYGNWSASGEPWKELGYVR